jgi:ferredoxin-fold anticodon binding domain-containing protein
MHLIKWHWQPDKRSASWKHTVIEQRRQIRLLLKSSPSLKPIVPIEVPDVWKGAREDAAEETDMTISTFPEDCPWDIESQILGSSWWPN